MEFGFAIAGYLVFRKQSICFFSVLSAVPADEIKK